MEETPLQAVEMVRAIRDALYEATKDLTRDEVKDYIARESAELRRQMADARPARRPDRPAA